MPNNTTKACPTVSIFDGPAADNAFRHKAIADAIADLILGEPGGRGIALKGQWGSGKSTIVGLASKDYALGGYSQGLPFGSGVNAKGLAGVTTDAAVNAVSPAGELLSVTGAAAPLAEDGMAGPVGLAKLAIDAAIFGASAAYCYAHP